jgi:hypothetical protein
VSYNRFVELMQACTFPLSLFLSRQRVAPAKGVAFIDTTALAVCENPHFQQHRVFTDTAKKARLLQAGFMAISCIWWSIMWAGSSFSACPGHGDD